MNPALAIQIAVSFVWLGLVLGISFLEAPLKFRAPGVTTAIGVGIGRLVFRTLNVIEAVLAVVALIAVLVQGAAVAIGVAIALIVVLVLGALVLRPLMDRRVRDGRTSDAMPRHNMHFFYIGLEVIKVVLLVWLGVLGLVAA